MNKDIVLIDPTYSEQFKSIPDHEVRKKYKKKTFIPANPTVEARVIRKDFRGMHVELVNRGDIDKYGSTLWVFSEAINVNYKN